MARPLVALGLDSLMALELRNHLEAEAGLAVPILFLLERRSGDDLVERLAEELGRQDPAGGGEQSEVVRL